jgi:UDP-GlcNAc:undecaprenyl-phosphate GlcNAc-1-phosphate transferase
VISVLHVITRLTLGGSSENTIAQVVTLGCAGYDRALAFGLAVMGEWAQNEVVGLFTPTLILGVPLFDIAFVGIVRILKRQVHSVREWLAYTGRDHIRHRFEALGLTRRQSVLLIYFIAVTLGLSALRLHGATPREAVLALIQAGAVLAIIAILEGVGRGRVA